MNALFDMDKEDAKAQHAALVKKIRAADKAYYQNDAPDISDADYDKLRQALEALEAEHHQLASTDSPTQTVGTPAAKGFKRVKHAVPMLSLSNVFSEKGVEEFQIKIRRFLGIDEGEEIELVAEPKIDGLSCSLRYENRKLVQE